jgi:hypothetical protein
MYTIVNMNEQADDPFMTRVLSYTASSWLAENDICKLQHPLADCGAPFVSHWLPIPPQPYPCSKGMRASSESETTAAVEREMTRVRQLLQRRIEVHIGARNRELKQTDRHLRQLPNARAR